MDHSFLARARDIISTDKAALESRKASHSTDAPSDRGKTEEKANYCIAREKEDALSQQEEEKIKACKRALQRIDDGTYGLCIKCGEPIDPARLEAVPTTEHCKSCKEEQARAEKQLSGVGPRLFSTGQR